MTVTEGRFCRYLNLDFILRLYRKNAEFRSEWENIVDMAVANRLCHSYDCFGHSPEAVYFHNQAAERNIRRLVNALKSMNSKYDEAGEKKIFKGFIKDLDTPRIRQEICDELFDIVLIVWDFGAEMSEEAKTS